MAVARQPARAARRRADIEKATGVEGETRPAQRRRRSGSAKPSQRREGSALSPDDPFSGSGRGGSQRRSQRRKVSEFSPTGVGEGMGYNKTSSSVGVLEAEFFAAMVLIALTIFTDSKASSDYASVMLAAMKRGTMIIILFFLLAILSAAGPNAGRAAKAFGALVIVGLILAQAENGLFSMLDNFFKADWSSGGTTGTSDSPGSNPSSANAAAGQQKNVNTTGIGDTGSNGSLGSDIQNVNVGGLTIQNIESGIGSIVSQLPAAAEHATDPVSDIPGLSAAIKKVLGWL